MANLTLPVLTRSCSPTTYIFGLKYYLLLWFSVQTKAEIYLGGYEALHYVLKSLVLMCSSSALALLTRPYKNLASEAGLNPHIDYYVQIFLENINNLIDAGYLTRARRAILMNWKVNISNVKFDFTLLVFVSCFIFND